jgi:hypothetical protein
VPYRICCSRSTSSPKLRFVTRLIPYAYFHPRRSGLIRIHNWMRNRPGNKHLRWATHPRGGGSSGSAGTRVPSCATHPRGGDSSGSEPPRPPHSYPLMRGPTYRGENIKNTSGMQAFHRHARMQYGMQGCRMACRDGIWHASMSYRGENINNASGMQAFHAACKDSIWHARMQYGMLARRTEEET